MLYDCRAKGHILCPIVPSTSSIYKTYGVTIFLINVYSEPPTYVMSEGGGASSLSWYDSRSGGQSAKSAILVLCVPRYRCVSIRQDCFIAEYLYYEILNKKDLTKEQMIQ